MYIIQSFPWKSPREWALADLVNKGKVLAFGHDIKLMKGFINKVMHYKKHEKSDSISDSCAPAQIPCDIGQAAPS